ncbi:nucleotidyl transferase AbiEii/AbiGii toxin family protein [Actinoplanes oblitus]|uniref:Nucleotidyl transferase AbiEii/AbiGii toxin family protein n=1 Tax=Actinoplanes oblitus TaxID=3040509 RepID=A0ABY8WN37_9ACTN|nr:nucleotidyl transferase AbiEii/AbiGii toxin family protein [Actinoplanes oblitus]WIM98247.1 nucleotidyl transferase AbiEii/AbiGii toxin family protein [Actinoplanes oblitus]
MKEISGNFETHLTVYPGQADGLAAFAAEHGAEFLHIELDRGTTRSQPMLTLRGSGTLTEQLAIVRDWCHWLRVAGMDPIRSKIEAAPWADGVPGSDEAARKEPAHRYFEHHVKLRLPARVADLIAITDLVEPHGARLSRNARKRSADGTETRFVNQRCSRVGRDTASRRLDRLVSSLREAGHEVVSVEQEYVVHDDNLRLDDGWLPRATTATAGQALELDRVAPRRNDGFPDTYRPVPGTRQGLVFDPALKQHDDAYRAGEPIFRNPREGERWRAARRAALDHVLGVLAGGHWSRHLVLRGSVTMPAWAGAAAREPGDLDFVVIPAAVASDSPQAWALLDGIVAELAARPGAGLRPDRVQQSAIWTYERADGRRLVIPFTGPRIPEGIVQVDIVFGEELPIPPEPITLPGQERPILAATAGLSLAWKLLWLATDGYPQGKDLYDAVLLAERTTVDLALVRDLMRPELGDEADRFTAESVLHWPDIQWDNFFREYPELVTEPHELPWLRRLAVALDRAWG